MKTLRLMLAFLIAPALPMLLVNVFQLSRRTVPLPPMEAGQFISMQGLGGFAYGSALVVGIPAYLVFRTRHLVQWWRYTIAGASIGTLPGVILLVSDLISGLGWELGGVALVFGVVYGALAGFTFWLVGIRSTGPHAGV